MLSSDSSWNISNTCYEVVPFSLTHLLANVGAVVSWPLGGRAGVSLVHWGVPEGCVGNCWWVVWFHLLQLVYLSLHGGTHQVREFLALWTRTPHATGFDDDHRCLLLLASFFLSRETLMSLVSLRVLSFLFSSSCTLMKALLLNVVVMFYVDFVSHIHYLFH